MATVTGRPRNFFSSLRFSRRGIQLFWCGKERNLNWLVVACCLVLITFVALTAEEFFALILHGTVKSSRMSYIEESNAKRYQKFRNAKNRVTPITFPRRWEEIKPSYELFHKLRNEQSFLPELKKRCAELTDLERIKDLDCRAEWMHQLEEGEIVKIEDMMGFAFGKKGGFELVFSDGRKAMYKPCGSGGEWPENEVRASHLDFALGFNRAPPSVMRNITSSSLKKIIEKQTGFVSGMTNSKIMILNQLTQTCSDNGVFFGAMIGWIHDLQATETIHKKFDENFSEQNIEVYRDTMDSHYLAEIQKNHLFFFLAGTMRNLGYNEYKVKTGELLTVDLDRIYFPQLDMHSRTSSYSVCYICKIDLVTLEQLQEAAEENTLSIVLQHSLLFDSFQLTFSKSEARVLQERLNRFLSKCFNSCVQRYGREEVILSRNF